MEIKETIEKLMHIKTLNDSENLAILRARDILEKVESGKLIEVHECEYCKILKSNSQSKFIWVNLIQKVSGGSMTSWLTPEFCPMCGKPLNT